MDLEKCLEITSVKLLHSGSRGVWSEVSHSGNNETVSPHLIHWKQVTSKTRTRVRLEITSKDHKCVLVTSI